MSPTKPTAVNTTTIFSTSRSSMNGGQQVPAVSERVYSHFLRILLYFTN